MKCTKVGYPTEFSARQKAMWLALTKPHQYDKPLRVYACSACMRWHITSKNK